MPKCHILNRHPPTISFSIFLPSAEGSGEEPHQKAKEMVVGCPREVTSASEARYSITTDPNAYAEVQNHCALRAARLLSFLELSSSKGQYLSTKLEPISNLNTINARSAQWLCISAYAFGARGDSAPRAQASAREQLPKIFLP